MALVRFGLSVASKFVSPLRAPADLVNIFKHSKKQQQGRFRMPERVNRDISGCYWLLTSTIRHQCVGLWSLLCPSLPGLEFQPAVSVHPSLTLCRRDSASGVQSWALWRYHVDDATYSSDNSPFSRSITVKESLSATVVGQVLPTAIRPSS